MIIEVVFFLMVGCIIASPFMYAKWKQIKHLKGMRQEIEAMMEGEIDSIEELTNDCLNHKEHHQTINTGGKG